MTTSQRSPILDQPGAGGEPARLDDYLALRRGQDAFERRFDAGIACLAPAPPGRG